MDLVVNGSPVSISDNASLLKLVEQLGLAERPGIAVAVNDHVIPRVSWSSRVLSTQDSVLIITASQGG